MLDNDPLLSLSPDCLEDPHVGTSNLLLLAEDRQLLVAIDGVGVCSLLHSLDLLVDNEGLGLGLGLQTHEHLLLGCQLVLESLYRVDVVVLL